MIYNFRFNWFWLAQIFKKKLRERLELNKIAFAISSKKIKTSNLYLELVFSSDQHNYETSSSTQGNLIKLFYKTNRYGKYSIALKVVV